MIIVKKTLTEWNGEQFPRIEAGKEVLLFSEIYCKYLFLGCQGVAVIGICICCQRIIVEK